MWSCKKCGKIWYYPVERCIYCNEPLIEQISGIYQIISHTCIYLPTPDHPDIPYYLYLLEGELGDRVLFKSMVSLNLTEKISRISLFKECEDMEGL